MSRLKRSQILNMPLKDIETSTKKFETCIGRGGYGMVYKGELSISGKPTTVAVKRLNEQFGQGLKEFLTEIQLLSGRVHPNLISLVGYCEEGKEKMIVYEYAERGSLDKYLRTGGADYSLTWLERLKICVDAARGLDFLHNHIGKDQTIIHRDIKSANILVDQNWVAKISDLGMSKLCFTGSDGTSIITHACGTLGYIEPEYIISGIVKKESDVYSFGMVLFEVLCGRLCSVKHEDGLLLSARLVKDYYQNEKLDELIDLYLWEQMSLDSMKKFSAIAYGCLQDDRGKRPSMDVVVKELAESLEIQVEYESTKLKSLKVLESDSDEYWETKLPQDAQVIIKRLSPRAIYNSKKELFSLLHEGFLFDNRKRFFSINKDGKKCELISAITFLHGASESFQWDLKFGLKKFYKSARFFFMERYWDIRFQIRTSMLSYNTMYVANLVFRYYSEHEVDSKLYMNIKWKMGELSVLSTHFAKGTKDGWLKLKLWFFINYKKHADFEIVIEEISKLIGDDYWDFTLLGDFTLQGIEFEPVDMKAEHKLENLSTLNEDIDWEDKFPSDYENLIQRSDKQLEYTTKNELYFLLCEGILIDNRKLWFSLCKLTGKKCHMLPAREVVTKYSRCKDMKWIAIPESRFEDVAQIEDATMVSLTCEPKPDMFTSCNFYSAYLVFKFLNDSHFEHSDKLEWEAEHWLDSKNWYKCKPIIKPKQPDSSMPKHEGFLMPYEKDRKMVKREDGWMEVNLCNSLYGLEEHNLIKMALTSKGRLRYSIIVQGIEFRPLQLGI